MFIGKSSGEISHRPPTDHLSPSQSLQSRFLSQRIRLCGCFRIIFVITANFRTAGLCLKVPEKSANSETQPHEHWYYRRNWKHRLTHPSRSIESRTLRDGIY